MQPMAGAPQIRETPPKRGVPSPLLILSLLLLIPGYKCQPTPHVLSPQETSDPPKSMLTILTHSNTSCSPKGGVRVLPVPPSQSGEVGTTLTLECHYQPPAAIVTWLQVCPRRSGGDSWANSWACSWPREVLPADGGLQVGGGEGLSTLRFRPLRHNHSGLYFCLVRTDTAAAQSCGTFVRVTEPVPEPFLRLGEATKNRILTAQGVLLLLCAVGPGLLLLFRKRWANEQLLQPKKIPCEEENLYEGLNLDECSMYEDISRGVQPTYQDVGTPPAADGLLEKP